MNRLIYSGSTEFFHRLRIIPTPPSGVPLLLPRVVTQSIINEYIYIDESLISIALG